MNSVTLPPGVAVRPHPAGGHTIAVPIPGLLTARVYVGQFNSAKAAAAFAVKTPVEQLLGMAVITHRRAA